MAELIHTKLVVEIQPARFLSLGFGDIACSQADLVCVSSFRERTFVPASAIGSIDRVLGPGVLDERVAVSDHRTEACTMVDLQGSAASFKQLLIVWMGRWEQFSNCGSAEQFIQVGLQAALGRVRNLEAPEQIDITALGTRYGGLQRRRIFDLLASWAIELFNQCPKVNHLRLVSYDLDTFVDFFEALHRLKSWQGAGLGIAGKLDVPHYGDFAKDVASAAQLLDQNPKQVLVICRTIVESVIGRLCEAHLKRKPLTLFEDIKELYGRRHVPPQINSFLHTCRVVGNFAVHPQSDSEQFDPSRRDAEAVMFLTLRIVEWFLGRDLPKPAS